MVKYIIILTLLLVASATAYAEEKTDAIFLEFLHAADGPPEKIDYLLNGESLGVGDAGFLALITDIIYIKSGTYLVNIDKSSGGPVGGPSTPWANHDSLFHFIVKKSELKLMTARSKEDFFSKLKDERQKNDEPSNVDSGEISRADKIARDVTIGEYREMYNYAANDERVIYRKKYIQQILRLDDKKLTAYFAKDKINTSLVSYSSMLESNRGYFNAPLTQEDIRDFKKYVAELKSQLDLLNKYYPSGNEIFQEMETDKW